MPNDEPLRQRWLESLNGNEYGNSNFLCIDHFDPSDVRKKGNRSVLEKEAVPIIERENEVEDESPSANDEQAQLSFSHSDVNVDLNLTNDSNECGNCNLLKSEINRLENRLLEMDKLHSAERSMFGAKLFDQKEKSKQHTQEKKRLNNSLLYHKNQESKLKSVIQSLQGDNLISNEAATDLNVILNCTHKYIH